MTVAKLESLLSSEHSLAHALSPPFEAMDQVFQREAARRVIMRQMLACHLFWRRHGDWPSDPKQLVPDILPGLEADPFGATGETLRWKRDGEALLIYSVAEDRTDNGGDIDFSVRSSADRGVRLTPAIAKPASTNAETREEKN